MSYTVEVVGKEKYALGEGPYYDPRYKRLSWVDILAGKLWLMNAKGEKQSVTFPQNVGAAIPLAENDAKAD